MLRKTSTLAFFAFMTSATFAVAEEHTILFLGDAFFPEVSYIHPGDTIRFVNAAATELNVMGEGAAWTVGPIAINGEATVNVTGNSVIKVNGKPLPAAEKTRLWRYHKPRGVLTAARDPEGRPVAGAWVSGSSTGPD